MSTPDQLLVLAGELPAISLAAALLAIGLAALLLAILHRPASNIPLTTFGATVALYGLRILAGLPVFRAGVPGGHIFWDYVVDICTYLLPALVFVFTDSFFGAGWYRSIRRAWQIHLAYAVAAITVDIVTLTPGAAMGPSAPLTVLWMTVALVNLLSGGIRIDRETGLVRLGFVVLVVLIANQNLVALGLVPWGLQIEEVGVVLFVAALGYALALRTFGNERRLAVLDHELRTARRIQMSLLPAELPQEPGMALAARYLPMTAVGGDLYDCLPVGERRLGLLVADVAGHGVPAALIASMVKSAAAMQSRVATQPAEVLEGINRHLCSQLDGQLVTAVYIYVDVDFDAGRLWHASAGHPPPLLLSDTRQQVSDVGDSGLVLGFIPETHYTTTELPFVTGDRLVLYTDGVVEATSPGGEYFETDRLRELLQQRTDLTPERWADYVLDSLRQWVGKPTLELDDDLTLIVLDAGRDA